MDLTSLGDLSLDQYVDRFHAEALPARPGRCQCGWTFPCPTRELASAMVAGRGRPVPGPCPCVDDLPDPCNLCGAAAVTGTCGAFDPGRIVAAEIAQLRADLLLERLTESLRHVALLEGGPYCLGWPDRWYESWTVRCEAGHVSNRALKMDGIGERCLACSDRGPRSGRLMMTFPEDVDFVLEAPEQIIARWRDTPIAQAREAS